MRTRLASPDPAFMYRGASAPDAPPLSATPIGCFMGLFFWIAACIIRAIWSEAPPAPAATTISTGLVGSHARVGADARAIADSTASQIARLVFMGSPLVVLMNSSPRSGARSITSRMKDQLLHSPIEQLGDEDHVLRWAGDRMNPAELLQLLARLPEHAEDLSVEAELVQPPRVGIGGEQDLVRAGRDAKRPRSAGSEGALLRVRIRLVADRGASVAVERNVDRDGAQEVAVAVEHLDAPVEAIGDVDVSLRIGGDVVGRIELARFVTAIAPRLQPVAVPVGLRDARIDVTVADVDVARGIERHVGDLAEAPVDRGH